MLNRGAEMQVMPEQDPKPKSKSRVNRSLLNTVLLVVILVIVSGGVGFGIGFQLGKREGARLTVKKVTDFFNPLNAVSDSPLIPQTLLGKVTDVNDSTIKVKLANGDEKEATLTDETKVTKQDKTISRGEIKVDSQVTVFTTGKDKDRKATRVIVR